MRIEVSEVNIDIEGHLRKVHADHFWLFAAGEWHRLYTPYVPMDTGMLFRQVNITPGQIEHNVPYAQRIYNGNFNFSKDKHPLATRMWDKVAEPTEKPKLIRAMQRYVDSGRLNFGG